MQGGWDSKYDKIAFVISGLTNNSNRLTTFFTTISIPLPRFLSLSKHLPLDLAQIACELLGYELDEFLKMTIDDVSAPSGAHVPVMFEKYCDDGMMNGSFALRNKAGQTVWIRFEAGIRPSGRMISTWTHYEIRDVPSME